MSLKKLLALLCLSSCFLLSSCYFDSDSNKGLVSLSIYIDSTKGEVSSNSIPKGFSKTAVAVLSFKNGISFDVSDQVTWHSRNQDILKIANNNITGLNTGSSSIYATYKNLISHDILVDVTAAIPVSIQLTPALTSLPIGLSQSYQALATFSDSSMLNITNEVIWSVTDASIASIEKGELTTLQIGSTDMSVSFEGLTSNTVELEVTNARLVSIQITSATINLAKGLNTTYSATGTYTDSSTQDLTSSVSWNSSDTNIATILNGSVMTLTEGSTVISAEFNEVTSNSSTLTVTDEELVSIQLTPATMSLAKGTSSSYIATGTYTDNSTQDITTSASWSSSDTDIAVVLKGSAMTLAEGSTTIRAEFNEIISNSSTLTVTGAEIISIQVTPATISLAKGTSSSYVATGTYTDSSNQDITASVSWNSSDTDIATIINGFLMTVTEGSSTISASLNGITSNSASLTVTAAELVSIQITPATISLAKGVTTTYVATGTYTDSSTQDITASVSWNSTDTNIVTILAGSATTVDEGNSTISASLNGITSNSASLTVTAEELISIQITPATISLAKGINTTYVATGTYTDNSTLNLTTSVSWSSSDTDVATILLGSVTTVDVGSTTISANLNGITSNSASLTVTAAELVSIQITPATITLVKGINTTYIATGTYTDSSTQDITSTVSWNSSDTGVATILTGTATTVGVGDTLVTASSNGITSNSANLTVTAEELVSIQMTPATISLAKGLETTFVATGTYTDNSTQDLTTSVSWNSSDTDVATILAGTAKTLLEGNTTISASYTGFTINTASLTVTAAELQSIQITSLTDILLIGRSSSYTAEGTYTDGTTQDINSTVSWGSSDTNLVTILADIVSGTATAVAQGSANITASQGGITASESLTLIDEVPVCGANLATGACIKTLSTADNKEFTGTPSLAVLISMGYTKERGKNNTGTTYSEAVESTTEITSPPGTFAYMQQHGASSAQSTRYCDDLSAVSFNSKTNWRQASSVELLALYAENPNRDLYTDHGWSLDTYYWTSTEYGANDPATFRIVSLDNGDEKAATVTNDRPVSCVSE